MSEQIATLKETLHGSFIQWRKGTKVKVTLSGKTRNGKTYTVTKFEKKARDHARECVRGVPERYFEFA